MDINADEHQTKNEYARPKEEVKRITFEMNKLLGSSTPLEGLVTFMMENSKLGSLASRNEIGGVDAAKVVDFEKYELHRLARCGEHLWYRRMDGDGEMLNIKEYDSSFIPIIGMKPEHFTTEAIIASCVVAQNRLTLVETLMDKKRWVEMFPCIVGKTNTIDVISTSIGENKGAALLLIKTELQIISDLVPLRKIKFLPYFKKHVDGLWVFVDVSVDTIKQGKDCSATDNDNGIFGKNDNVVYSGSLVTIGFKMMANNLPATNLPLESIKNANDLIS
uniref:Homeobox protein n=1 Tax=Solanum tuberosum TaxID=4113 RepID=M1DW22_SOLTU